MKDVQKTRVESQQGDTHVVKETTKTTVSSKKPMSSSAEQLIQQVPLTKQQLTYAVPIVLAVVLALAIMYFRNGGLFGHHVQHQPTYTEQASNIAAQLKENLMPRERTWSEKASDYLMSYVPFYHKKTTYEQAQDMAAQAGHYAKEKASQAAEYAQEKLSPTAQRAADLAAEKAQQAAEYAKTHGSAAAKEGYAKAKEAAQYAYEKGGSAAKQAADAAEDAAHRGYASAKDSVNDARDNVHDYAHSQRSYATQAKDYVADKISEVTDSVKSTISGISETVQHTMNAAKETARHDANVAAENARHAAADLGTSAQDTYNTAKVKGHEYRREAKDKLAQAGENL